MMKGRLIGLIVILGLVAGTIAACPAQTFGVKKKRPKFSEYGNVTMSALSKGARMAPVVFPHWLHRARYTCRLCHVDIGFAMEANGTGMTEEENRAGMYCGACHDGREAFAPEEKHGSKTVKNCDLCHSKGKDVEFRNSFPDLKKKLPRERLGNGIDWLKAEETGGIKLVDYIEGISIKRKKLKDPEPIELKPKETGMPDIIFSHEKHAVWNGCELCHPDIFNVKKKTTKHFRMKYILERKFCGVCHFSVAFTLNDCRACHPKMRANR